MMLWIKGVTNNSHSAVKQGGRGGFSNQPWSVPLSSRQNPALNSDRPLRQSKFERHLS